MKFNLRPALPGALLLCGLLTACMPFRPPVDAGVTFNFRLPEGAETQQLRLAALYTAKDADGNIVQKVVEETYGYVNVNEGYLTLRQSELKKVLSDGCLPYRADKVKPTLTPAQAKTCDINFVAYDAAAAAPTTASLRYLTHDTYSYASEDLTYTSTVTGQEGDTTITSQESGERRKGWTLVSHLVLNPATTPNLYRVVRNSASEDRLKLQLPLNMHAPSDYFTSMGTQTGGAQ